MKWKIARRTLYFLVIVSSTLLVVFIADVWLSYYIEKDIKERIELIHGHAGSIKVTLFSRTLTASSVSWSSTPHKANLREHSLSVKTITATGISLYELFKHKTLSFDQVTIDSGKFQFDRSSVNIVSKSTPSETPIFKFKLLTLKAVQTQITVDSVVGFRATLNADLKELRIERNEESVVLYSVKSLIGTTSDISINRHQGMYGMTIAKIAFNTDEESIIIDSTSLIPNYGKFEFAQKEGRQASRINISVPRINITGLDYKKLADTSWIASKIEIQSMNLHSFKDKRIIEKSHKKVPMPMEVFLKLPYAIKVDSLIIQDANISVEEFPVSGITSGTITFNKLNANIAGFNNRIIEGDPTYATVQATALLQNVGAIKASFRFPQDGSATYYAQGSVSQLPFTHLNTLLKNMIDIQVESGHLNQLTFDFMYDDLGSKGLLNVDYEDLRITILDKNKRTTNELKTLLVNAFVKTNIKKSRAVKPGLIDIERDQQKFIFNLWSKSVLAGLKNSMLGAFGKKKDRTKPNSQSSNRK